MENILPRREARENAFLLAFSQTFGDIPLQEALDNHHECDEEHPVDVFGQRLLRAYYEHSAGSGRPQGGMVQPVQPPAGGDP